jgi:hypothetical protein
VTCVLDCHVCVFHVPLQAGIKVLSIQRVSIRVANTACDCSHPGFFLMCFVGVHVGPWPVLTPCVIYSPFHRAVYRTVTLPSCQTFILRALWPVSLALS